ncbi:hypothetical protein BS78_07G044300 [Paspalum vaginatum]|nr:hypothetical protein BS78_07G044300 [Paspalum vaginatum]
MGVVIGSKRRRLEEKSCCQQLDLSGGGGGGEQEDDDAGVELSSRLPDDVLGDVITLLTTKDIRRPNPGTAPVHKPCPTGGRRPLWRSAPLNLEVRALAAVDAHRAAAILGAHHAPARRLCVAGCWHKPLDRPVLDTLLRHPGLDSLEELELNCCADLPVAAAAGSRRPPPPVLRFSATVRVLSVCWYGCSPEPFAVMEATAPALDFPRLTRLTLRSVNVSEAALHGILSRCHILQSLVLHHNIGYRRVRISSSTLRSIGIADGARHGEKVEQVIVENAPLLERLILDCSLLYGLDIQVIQAPKLKVLGHLYSCKGLPRIELEPATMVSKRMEPVSLNNVMRTVKILSLISAPNLNLVISFLRCFP